MARILLVDDDEQSLESTRKILEFSGHQVVTATDGQAALELIRPSAAGVKADFDLVVTDVRMPRMGGLEFLRAISLCGERIPVILMTAFGRVEDAVWAMKLGAVDFLTKPFKKNTLLTAVESVLKRLQAGSNRVNGTEAVISSAQSLSGVLIGGSAPMQRLRVEIERVAPTVATVLIRGESGTGKELVARCVHQLSARKDAPFIALNCAALPENLIESELFGYEKGAFTGAGSPHAGLFESAHGGALLLDEIGDMPLSLQAKLLRVLQEGEVRRVGATQSRKVDVRVLAATHRNLKEMVAAGQFRQDLLYRLEVVTIEVPSLRERKDDLRELVGHFLLQAAERHGKSVQAMSSSALDLLLEHSWPGNIRELSNVIERSVVFATHDEILPEDLPSHLQELRGKTLTDPSARASTTIEVPMGASLEEVEELLIRKTLETTGGDKNLTAKLLGINARTITRKLDKR